jgi:hypothetical protein
MSHPSTSIARQLTGVLIVVGVLACCPAVFAQSAATAALRGDVLDPSAAVVVDAAVTLRHLETGLERRAATDADGRFVATQLPPGPYSLTITTPGFATYRLERLDLRVNDERTIRITLALENVVSSIQVGATLIRDKCDVAQRRPRLSASSSGLQTPA